MSRDVQVVRRDQAIGDTDRFMPKKDVGSMPVCDGDRLVRMLSDRDIAVRAVAEGRGPDTPVSEAMSDQVEYCFDGDEVEAVAMKMSDALLRRFPVISREDRKLVGTVSPSRDCLARRHQPIGSGRGRRRRLGRDQ